MLISSHNSRHSGVFNKQSVLSSTWTFSFNVNLFTSLSASSHCAADVLTILAPESLSMANTASISLFSNSVFTFFNPSSDPKTFKMLQDRVKVFSTISDMCLRNFVVASVKGASGPSKYISSLSVSIFISSSLFFS